MKDHDSRFPDDLRDIAERLTAARAQPSALELDELCRRLRGRVADERLAPRRGPAKGLRTNGVAAALTLGLVLSSGVGVVFACGSLGVHKPPVATIASQGGNPGNQGGDQGGNQGDPGNYGGVFQGTSFHGRGSASFCQYNGPQTYTYRYRTSHGWMGVILTWDCFHLYCHFEFDPDKGYRFGGFNYRWGNGPSYNGNQSSYDTTAPDGTNELSFSTDGSTFNVPIAW